MVTVMLSSTPVICPPTVIGELTWEPYCGMSTEKVVSSLPTTSHGASLRGPNRMRCRTAAVDNEALDVRNPTPTCAPIESIEIAVIVSTPVNPKNFWVKFRAVWSASRCQASVPVDR